jgi:16S rRNA (cytidine1402-2'-O)-methyltransferase
MDELLRAALARLSVKEAVAEVAAVTGEPRRDVYQRALALDNKRSDGERRHKDRDHGR